MTKDSDTQLPMPPQQPEPTKPTHVAPVSNDSAKRSRNIKKAARKKSPATAGKATARVAAATADGAIDPASKAGNGDAVNAATEATAGNSTDKSSNNNEEETPTKEGGTINAREDDLHYLLAEYTSRALKVPIAVGVVLCLANVTDQTFLNLDVNQANPDETKLVELMKSFTQWGSKVKSFDTDKIVAFLCSKDGLAKQNLEEYVSTQPIR